MLPSSSIGDPSRLDPSEIDFDADTIEIQRAARVYHDVGFIIVRGLMKKYVEPMLAEVREAVTLAHRELPEATSMQYGWLTPSGGIFTDRVVGGRSERRQLIVAPMTTLNSTTMKSVAGDSRLLEILDVLLQNEVNLIGTGQCMYKEALLGNEASLHQDAIYPGGEGYRDIVSTFTYLVPTSLENGCIWLVPYSQGGGLLPHEESGHRAGCLPRETCDFDRAVPLPGEAGDTLFWNYMLIHGSKANVTEKARPAVVTRYGKLARSPQ